MIPAAFVFLEALPLTPNGKVDRRALPAPIADRAELDPVYEAPRRLVEQLLAQIWAEVLGIAQVGVHDNFFALGGDSILSIQIISKANRAGLRLTPEQLFQHQTIAELATVAGASRGIHAEQTPITGELPLTPVQRWFFEHDFADPDHWNQALLLQPKQPLGLALLRSAVHHILAHHDALRLRFNGRGALPQQLNAAVDREVPCVMIDLSCLLAEAQSQTMATLAAELHASLNLAQGPLLRVALIELGPTQGSRLLIIVHHLAIDGVSWRVLLEDLQTSYQQLHAGRAIELPPKTTSFKHWAERLAKYAASATLQAARDYWLAPLPAEVASLPVDYPGGKNSVASALSVAVRLSAEETRVLLQEIPTAYTTEINDALLMALVRAFANWTAMPALLVDLEGHGREALFEDIDLSRTVGWFTSIFPVRLIAEQGQPSRALKAIKEQLRRVPQRGIGYGLLRYLSDDPAVTTALRARPQAGVSFNYLGQLDSALHQSDLFQLAGEPSGAARSLRGERSHLLEINGYVIDGQLRFDWTYSTNLHRRATVERLAEDFGAALRALLAEGRNGAGAQGSYTPQDFPLAHLDQQKLDKVLTKLKRKKP
jgi:non-ribosomal peptide synthase protein (TIGR01720 family)